MGHVHKDNKGSGTGNAPQSLVNLKPIYGADRAREMQKRSAESRTLNAEIRSKMKLTVQEFKAMKEDLDMSDAPSALEFLKFHMVKLMSDAKYDEAAEVAKSIAEYEAPKLSRVDQSTLNLDSGDLTDEQLDEEMAKLKK
tara:strand:+ start:2110 stop:2529 length:420 start_codon:yes stop_codon:yes gene_type:complete